MLLATSLKRFLDCDYECVAAIPQPETQWGTISKDTQRLMQILGVRSVPITNTIDENYPIGNKVACLGIDTAADTIIFLDSDILCVSEFIPQFKEPFNAKPADLATLTRDVKLWQQMYALLQLPFPKRRMLATVSGELMLPYFNGGVIAVQNGINFAQAWEECCRMLDAEDSITNKRPWLDQFALPIAVTKLNLAYNCLDERFNYPSHLKPLSQSLPFLAHYHWPTVIRREPRLNQLVVEFCQDYPLLEKLLLSIPEWAQLLKPYNLQKPSPRLFFWQKPKLSLNQPTGIITGIPRSGTSYLCSLLHSIPNCIAINEPTPIFPPLTNDLIPWQIATFYQDLRRDILDGKPIENKVHNGQLIEDTAVIDVKTPYQPQVTRADFFLSTKNTLAYIARLPQLKRVLPTAAIIACVRHPLDTIASWKTSFSHLEHATVTEFPVGHVKDPFLSTWQRQRLAEIAASSDEALKRALLWRYLAEIVLTNELIIVRYEDLVTQPVSGLKAILQQIPHAPPCKNMNKIMPSTVRQKREVLDKSDLQAIFDICGECMVELGYKY